jgi:tight adherence protein B
VNEHAFGPVRRRSAAVVIALITALGALVAGAPPSGAQQAGPAVEVVGADISSFPSVVLRVALAPAVATAGLSPDDITVTENGDAVDAQVIALADQQVGVVLVLDTSGSIRDALDAAKAAAADLLDVLPGDAPVSVIGFGSSAAVASDFTTDRGATADAIENLEAQGGTALYDAVLLAAEQVEASPAERNAIVLLSDGADSDSQADVDEATQALEAGVDDFYIVSLQTEETDLAALSGLADAAGGRVVAAEDAEALADTYVDLGQRIVNQYEVSFTSTTPDPTGTWEIAVEGTDASGSIELALPDRDRGAGRADEPAEERALPGVLTLETEPAFYQQGWVLWAGALMVGAALATLVGLAVPAGAGSEIVRRREARRSLRSDAAPAHGDDSSSAERALDSVRSAATRVASAAVERTESTGKIDAALDRAGLVMRAGEYAALVVAIAIGAAVLGYLLLGVVGGALGLFVPLLGAGAFLNFKASRRNKAFGDQLSDALMIMSGSLRSGFGVGQAIDTVAEEMDAPLGQEFRRAILETRLGRDVEDALDGVANRVQNEDFAWVVDAMRINRTVGGDLAQILDQVGETIRARNRLKRQVAALTAEGRISAMVLGFLPIGMALILFSSNPDYMRPLFSRTIGLIMLAVAVALLVAGALWLKKLIDVEY